MEEIKKAIDQLINNDCHKMVFSVPTTEKWRKATITKKQNTWQCEMFTKTQAFHENIDDENALSEKITQMLVECFSQLTAFSDVFEYGIRLTKKGKVLTNKKAIKNAVKANNEHDKQKKRPLKEGIVIPPLVDIGVLTSDGQVIASKRDKYTQINRFVQLVEDFLPKDTPKTLRVVDVGCGVSYLTFVLYYYLSEVKGIDVDMVGVDRRAELIEVCVPAAKKYGYSGLHFENCDIAEYTPDASVDMVVSLHACDTATDLALARAVQWGAQMVFSVPCCQYEVNGQINSEELSLITRYGIVKERVSALFTDAIRANVMVSCGYKTQLVEFVGFEHTPKNIMIRSQKTGQPQAVRKKARDEVEKLCQMFSLKPFLIKELEKSK